MDKKVYILAAVLVLIHIFHISSAQVILPPNQYKNNSQDTSYVITGTVRHAETREFIASAEVFIEGAGKGTLTDNLGSFSIKLKPGNYTLVCSCMGFHEKRIPVTLNQDQKIEILLEVKQHEIHEVEVVGKLEDIGPVMIGRPVEQISAGIVNSLNTNDVNDALHGRIPGVWTTKVSGAPGDHNRIRIRGLNSIFGSVDPLYVVDGMIVPIVNSISLGISDLNTHDVENITVLKDASSTALYGYLGGNGVILIDTKKGGGKTQFNLNVRRGIQVLSKRYDLMNSEEFLSTIDSSDRLLGTSFYKYYPSAGIYPKYPHFRDSLGNTLGSDDFQSALFRTGQIAEYQLSGQGSFKKIDYYISGNYYNHDGIVTNSNYNKYSFTGNFSKDISKKLSLRILYKGSHQENKNSLDNYLGNNVILKGINYEPSYMYTPDSIRYQTGRAYYNNYTSPIQILNNGGLTPNVLIHGQEKEKLENSNTANMHGTYIINDNLSAQASLALSFRDIVYSSDLPFQDQFLKSEESVIIIDQQYDLKYKRQFKNHGLEAFVRYRDHRDNTYWNIDSFRNIDIDAITIADDIYLRGSQAIYGQQGSTIRSIRSAIFNANYNYKKRYFFSLITNYDHLNEGHYVNRNNLFSSFALNWDLAKESFLPVPSWVNSFNLYLNWGQTGNYPLNSLSDDLYYTLLKYTHDSTTVNGVIISNLANHHIVHEEIHETNLGTRISLIRDRVNLSGDYYIKKYFDLLIYRTIPLHYGGGLFLQNIGEMRNTGLELSLELVPVNNHAFYWSTRAGFSTNKQYITKLKDGEPINLTNTDILYPDFIIRENETLGAITGYKYRSKWIDLTDSEIESKKYFNYLGIAYLKVDTLNKKVLTQADKTIIGNSIPDFTINWINTIEYKNFSCEMLWYGVIGCDKYNATKAATFITGTNVEVRNMVLDKVKGITNHVFYESSYFVEDASFIRLKTLSFSYSPAKKIASRISMKFTLSFENLVTLTHYSGYDPEATIYTNNNFSDNAIDKGAYPSPRGTYFSISLTF